VLRRAKFYSACTPHLNVNTRRQGLSKLRTGEVESKICLWVRWRLKLQGRILEHCTQGRKCKT